MGPPGRARNKNGRTESGTSKWPYATTEKQKNQCWVGTQLGGFRV